MKLGVLEHRQHQLHFAHMGSNKTNKTHYSYLWESKARKSRKYVKRKCNATDAHNPMHNRPTPYSFEMGQCSALLDSMGAVGSFTQRTSVSKMPNVVHYKDMHCMV